MTDVSEIPRDALELATGGTFTDLVKSGFGLRSLYRGVVKEITADIGGWKLANQMYGSPEHGASLGEKLRARRAIKNYLDGSDQLPSWAPNW